MTKFVLRLFYKTSGLIHWVFNKLIRVFKPIELEKALFIFGEPRTGSTWLMELLNHNLDIVVVWEPFNRMHGLLNNNQVNGRLYCPPNNHDDHLKQLIVNVISLRQTNTWTLNFATFRRLLLASRSLTKSVRGALLLPWVAQTFELESKPVYITRHPASVVLSQINGHIKMDEEMPSDNIISLLYPKKAASYINYLSTLKTELNKGFALWCICNKYILEHPLQNKWHLVFYENLLLNPIDELNKIEQLWGFNLDVDPSTIRKASRTDFQRKYKNDVFLQLTKWPSSLSDDEIPALQAILDFFEITQYSMLQNEPCIQPL